MLSSEVWVRFPSIADNDTLEVLPKNLLQDLFAPVLPDSDTGFSHGCKDPDPILIAVNLYADLICVDDIRGSYLLKDPIVLWFQPHGNASEDLQDR